MHNNSFRSLSVHYDKWEILDVLSQNRGLCYDGIKLNVWSVERGRTLSSQLWQRQLKIIFLEKLSVQELSLCQESSPPSNRSVASTDEYAVGLKFEAVGV